MTDPTRAAEGHARAAFRGWTAVPIRFGDQDPLGHVNNVAIASYFEHARCTHLIPAIRAQAPAVSTVIARITIDYVAEIHFPGTVDVGLRLTRGRNKSFLISSGIFRGETCCAFSEATMVFFDTTTRSTVKAPETVWERLAHLL